MLCDCGKEFEGNFCPYCGKKKPQKMLCQCGKEFEGNFCPYCGATARLPAADPPSPAVDTTPTVKSEKRAEGCLQKIAAIPMHKLLFGTLTVIAAVAVLLYAIVSVTSHYDKQRYIARAQNDTFRGVSYKTLFDHLSDDCEWQCPYTGDFNNGDFAFNAIVKLTGTCLVDGVETPYTVTFQVKDDNAADYTSEEDPVHVVISSFEMESEAMSEYTTKERLGQVYNYYVDSVLQESAASSEDSYDGADGSYEDNGGWDGNEDWEEFGDDNADFSPEEQAQRDALRSSESSWVLTDHDFFDENDGRSLGIWISGTDYLIVNTQTSDHTDMVILFGITPSYKGADDELVYCSEVCKYGDAIDTVNCDFMMTYYPHTSLLTLKSDYYEMDGNYLSDSSYLNLYE